LIRREKNFNDEVAKIYKIVKKKKLLPQAVTLTGACN
jgi:hypothetical protein